jgi:hypothetical protein
MDNATAFRLQGQTVDLIVNGQREDGALVVSLTQSSGRGRPSTVTLSLRARAGEPARRVVALLDKVDLAP